MRWFCIILYIYYIFSLIFYGLLVFFYTEQAFRLDSCENNLNSQSFLMLKDTYMFLNGIVNELTWIWIKIKVLSQVPSFT